MRSEAVIKTMGKGVLETSSMFFSGLLQGRYFYKEPWKTGGAFAVSTIVRYSFDLMLGACEKKFGWNKRVTAALSTVSYALIAAATVTVMVAAKILSGPVAISICATFLALPIINKLIQAAGEKLSLKKSTITTIQAAGYAIVSTAAIAATIALGVLTGPGGIIACILIYSIVPLSVSAYTIFVQRREEQFDRVMKEIQAP